MKQRTEPKWQVLPHKPCAGYPHATARADIVVLKPEDLEDLTATKTSFGRHGEISITELKPEFARTALTEATTAPFSIKVKSNTVTRGPIIASQ